MTIPTELAEAVRTRRIVLFVGAGVSATMGLPTWSDLIDRIADELGYDPEIFRTFGDAWTLAEFYRIRQRSLGSLRSWMDREWHSSKFSITTSEAHRLIVELDFPIIYTTNYDRWLEHAYSYYGKSFVKVLGVDDLASLASQPSSTAIVKFHGDFDDDTSLVLTETHFLKRLELESPLDIRLRSDLLGRSALFIGYSLSDPNMRRLLYKLRLAWEAAGLVDDQPSSFLFASRPNPVQEAVLKSWGLQTVLHDAENPTASLIGFLQELLDTRT